MKRSDAVKKLLTKVISPYEVIKQEYYEQGIYHDRAEKLLDFIENTLGMLPPLNEEVYHHMDNDDRVTVNQAKPYFTWEEE